MSWLSKAFRFILGAVERIWSRISPKVLSDFEQFAEEFADIALTAVKEQAILTLSGEQKLSNAAAEVMRVAQSRGWTLLQTAAITLVQDVYAAQKAAQSPLVAPPGDLKTAEMIKGRPL